MGNSEAFTSYENLPKIQTNDDESHEAAHAAPPKPSKPKHPYVSIRNSAPSKSPTQQPKIKIIKEVSVTDLENVFRADDHYEAPPIVSSSRRESVMDTLVDYNGEIFQENYALTHHDSEIVEEEELPPKVPSPTTLPPAPTQSEPIQVPTANPQRNLKTEKQLEKPPVVAAATQPSVPVVAPKKMDAAPQNLQPPHTSKKEKETPSPSAPAKAIKEVKTEVAPTPTPRPAKEANHPLVPSSKIDKQMDEFREAMTSSKPMPAAATRRKSLAAGALPPPPPPSTFNKPDLKPQQVKQLLHAYKSLSILSHTSLNLFSRIKNTFVNAEMLSLMQLRQLPSQRGLQQMISWNH